MDLTIWIAVLVACIAIQRVVEALDPLFISAARALTRKGSFLLLDEGDLKKAFSVGTSVVLGCIVAVVADLSIFCGLTDARGAAARKCGGGGNCCTGGYELLTGLLIGGGSETFNSLLKLLGYAKDTLKGVSAARAATADTAVQIAGAARVASVVEGLKTPPPKHRPGEPPPSAPR